MDTISKATTHLESGDIVETSEPEGDDFGIPLVHPVRGKHAVRVAREVRNVVRCRGGLVVWFQDGTKTAPTHGARAWEAWS